MNKSLYELGGKPMFDKLNKEVEKSQIKEKATSFKSLKERKDFEKEIIFGNLLEELVSVKIEKVYKEMSEDEKQNGIT
jgi:hypothetical protein